MSATATSVAELSRCAAVSVRYGRAGAEVSALEEVDLAVGAGETVALRGPSGSGKTTLLQLIGGLLVPSGGEVSWRGKPLSSLEAAARGSARAGGIAYVFQGSNLLPNFTALENVAFAAWVAERAGRPVRQEPSELLELVGLATKAKALPAELSGGEAQRVALARALAESPALLLCDEPTGHLDSDTATRVLDLLAALHERFSFALVIATHDRATAARCQREVRLLDGRVVEGELP
ncbi:MAG TPA: ABC transporter ATP-binding protein [Solirubrobacterales bacterium]|nr:ABC transporter ATP-binding protein [Solirubrobacterales bacterium]